MSDMVKELIDAGIHYGHRASRWNPKMKPYIYGKRNNLHIIDVKETLRGLLLAKKFIAQTVSRGKDALFIGTKRQARKSVQKHAERIGMHWVNDRWLGGTLTNFREIRKRVGRLDQLEQMETDGLLDAYSKKEGSSLRREMRKILKNLGGIRKMTRQPGVMIVVDSEREHIAVREARKMGIPVIALMDTDANPDPIDIPIPGNDDAMRAIEVVIRELANAVEVGMHTRVETDQSGEKPQPRRRSRRATTARAEDAGEEDADDAEDSMEESAAPAVAEPATEQNA
ncbi:MAG: 30S ribosomal protein S2 [Phycisphaerae bacterium]|nr:30S ribosomal protein S2 [Phycisphaerae bacterium]